MGPRLTTGHDAASLAAKPHGIDATHVARPAPQRRPRRHIPQEDLTVAAHAGEARIVVRDGQIQHLVAVRRVRLHQARRRGAGAAAAAGARLPAAGAGGGRREVGPGALRVEEADGAVGGAGQNLERGVSVTSPGKYAWRCGRGTHVLAEAGGEGDAVDGT